MLDSGSPGWTPGNECSFQKPLRERCLVVKSGNANTTARSVVARSLLVICGLWSGWPPALAGHDEDLQPRNTQAAGQHPPSPQQAWRALTVPDGFQVTLAAAEPDVRQPIAIAFDDRGRLWVAESYSYDGSHFTEERHDQILIFEDTNGDGRLNERTVFHRSLSRLTGLALGFGGVWIASAPHLAFIPDRDADDRPDGPPVVHLDGWSLKAEHNTVNGLTWGPDGWLYGRHGIKQPSLVGKPGTKPERRTRLSCCIWRYHPTRHKFEVVADGTINPWGLDFDVHGHGFLSTSVVEHLWHLVPGAHYTRWKDRRAHPDPFLYELMDATSDHLHWGGNSWSRNGRAEGNERFGGGHAHCDAMIYLGNRWPRKYRGAVFLSNIHGHRINQDQLHRKPDGLFVAGHGSDFLTSSDPWFRAVSMEYGPDGDVYLTDWSDMGECHDRDGVHRTSGRIYKISWGAPRRVDVDLSRLSDQQLVDLQRHANAWYRRHARRRLQERAAGGRPMNQVHRQLEAVLNRDSDPQHKLRAMWTLHVTQGLRSRHLLACLQDTDEHLRAWAVRLLTDDGLPPAGTVDSWKTLATRETSWLVKLELASALRRLPPDQQWDIAGALAKPSGTAEPNLERMVWYAIQPSIVAQPHQALDLLKLPIAARIRRFIARRLADQARSDPSTSDVLLAALRQPESSDDLLNLLRGLNASLKQQRWNNPPAGFEALLPGWLEHTHAGVRRAAITAAAILGNTELLNRVAELVHDPHQDTLVRQTALTALATRRPARLAGDIRQLLTSAELLEPTLRIAEGINDIALKRLIITGYPKLPKGVRPVAIDALISRTDSALLLLSAIEQERISARDVSAQQARQLQALKHRPLTERLEQVWGSLNATSAERKQQLATLKSQLSPAVLSNADAERGRGLFTKRCAACHRLFGAGRAIAPELTGSGRKSLDYLLTNIVDPNAVVPADFRLSIIVMNSGRVITGSIVSRSDQTLTVQTRDQQMFIDRREIESVHREKTSLMPENLLKNLAAADVADLFSYLMSDGPPARLPSVVLLGDSIRINYQATVTAQLAGQASVWSPSKNGAHTAFTLNHLEEWLKDRNPSVVHINVGLHDLFLNAKTGKPRHSLQVYDQNLRAIFVKLRELTDAEILFALTTDVDEQRQAASTTYGRIVRRRADVGTYNARAREIAKQFQVRVNDLPAAMRSAGIQRMLAQDGIHLSEAGKRVLGQQVARQVLAALRRGRKPVP